MRCAAVQTDRIAGKVQGQPEGDRDAADGAVRAPGRSEEDAGGAGPAARRAAQARNPVTQSWSPAEGNHSQGMAAYCGEAALRGFPGVTRAKEKGGDQTFSFPNQPLLTFSPVFSNQKAD